MKDGIKSIGIGVIAADNCIDTDGDSVPDSQEFAGDTDNDGLQDYVDNDDDGDDILTKDEHPDPNGDCNTDDAFDSDADGVKDYLQPYVDDSKDHLEVF